MEDDVKRERKMDEHSKVGKCMKKDVQTREKAMDELET
jgi:seryl-tRNA synthetase